MKVTVRAAGILKSGPERDMCDDYLKRANMLARGLGFTTIEEIGFDVRAAKNKAASTQLALSAHKPADILVILDEYGKDIGSRDMASKFARWRDDGHKQLTILIGAADGFDRSQFPQNVEIWRLGKPTWPHMLARVMICEQIYRALSILARTPYHRD
ncbi:MAG TPA: 23S rRNA (pseudouridine(1915)-N(3))-methyltransferase RlmH [Hellea balneolensis]|uniref:Ribosomal RNA large subunit methyltransferase H n=1 Tax=Hellea balneolensis TaxID=287478 RepID=A0A7C5QQH7_9PROT|nr:23S rRNA (pseudouridine(1915)-N(3))-methyltransferase RlmH [Hellea balneolensis]